MSSSIWLKISAGVTLIFGIYTSYKVINYLKIKKLKPREVSNLLNQNSSRSMITGKASSLNDIPLLAYIEKNTYYNSKGSINRRTYVKHLVSSKQPSFNINDLNSQDKVIVNLDNLIKIHCERPEITHEIMVYSFLDSILMLINQVFAAFTDSQYQPNRSIKTKVSKISQGGQIVCLGELDKSSKVFQAEFIGSSKEAILDYYYKSIKTPVVVLAIFTSITLFIRYVVTKDKIAAEDADEEVPSSLECCVCINRKKNIILWPCKHVCICDVCMKNNITHCPICRERITHQFRINY